MNDKIHLKLLKSKSRNNSNSLLLDQLKYKTVYSLTNKRVTPIGSGYFPKDYSLNIYKSTSFYKKRYQIEPFKLKYQIKCLKTPKNSKKIDYIIKLFKAKEKKNHFSSDLLRLIKSNKIDRFAKRYLEKYKLNTNIINKSSSPKNEYKEFDEDKFKNDIIFNNLMINSENRKSSDNKNQSEDTLTFQHKDNNTKNIKIKSENQPNIINKFKCYNMNTKRKHKFIGRNISSQSYNILSNNYLVSSLSSCNNTPININDKNQNKKNQIFKSSVPEKKNKKIKLFYTKKIKSILNDNVNNKLNNKKKLIFSFYDPNDKDIKLFQKLEQKLKNNNNINYNL